MWPGFSTLLSWANPPSLAVVLGPPFTLPCLAPMVALGSLAFAPGTMVAQHVVALGQATSLHRCPPTWDKVTDCPAFPDGCGQVWACPLGHCQAAAGLIPAGGRSPKTQRPAQRRRHLGLGGDGAFLPLPASVGQRALALEWDLGTEALGGGSGGDKGQQGPGSGRPPRAPRVKGGPSCGGTSPVTAASQPRPGRLPCGTSVAVLSRSKDAPRFGGVRQAQTRPRLLLLGRPARPAPEGRCPRILAHPEPPGLAQGPELNLEAQLVTAAATSLRVLATTRRREQLTPVTPKGPQLPHAVRCHPASQAVALRSPCGPGHPGRACEAELPARQGLDLVSCPGNGQEGRRVTGERLAGAPAASSRVALARPRPAPEEAGRGARAPSRSAHCRSSSLAERAAPGAECGEDVPALQHRRGHRRGSHVREPVELPVRTLGGAWGWAGLGPLAGELGQARRAGRPGSRRLGPSAEGSGPGQARGQGPRVAAPPGAHPCPGGRRGQEPPQEQSRWQDALGA